MDIFSGKLRLSGSILNELSKIGMTAPEVILLRTIHGADAVCELRRTGTKMVNHAAERERLADAYGEATNGDGANIYRELFGGQHLELPTKLIDYQDPETLPVVENIVTEDTLNSILA